MKTLLIIVALMGSTAMANNIQCSPAEKYDLWEWTVEVSGVKAAFFDNDTWSDAPFKYDLEMYPAIRVFEASNFSIHIQEFPMPNGSIKGTLYLTNGEAMELDCRYVQSEDFYYL